MTKPPEPWYPGRGRREPTPPTDAAPPPWSETRPIPGVHSAPSARAPYRPYRPNPPWPNPPRPAWAPPPAPARRSRGAWYFVVWLLSAGLLTPVPFVHAAVRTGRRACAAYAAAWLAVVVGIFVTDDLAPSGADGRAVGPSATIFALLFVLLIVGGLAHLVVLRRQVFGTRDAPVAPRAAPAAPDPSVTAALAARERRAEARRLATDDPLLARELRIGRPDLTRTYDDGGLVDLVSAPVEVVADVCGIERPHAEELVRAREAAAGHLLAVDDLLAYADLPVTVWDQVRDRGIVLGAVHR